VSEPGPAGAAVPDRTSRTGYDAVIVVSFGGPEGDDQVIPFLERVLHGRPVPPDRLEQIAGHYRLFGGVSPINGQNRALVAALQAELDNHDHDLPVYWGNRNWHPFLADTVARMRDDGVGRALAFVTSAYASYSGCRQYLEDLARARADVGRGAPEIDKLRLFYNHPGFVAPNADNLIAALARADRDAAVAFTAHSLPEVLAATSEYTGQLIETAGLVAATARRTGWAGEWQLVYQSRSGPPSQPWLGPDIGQHIQQMAADGVTSVVVAPIGFVSDHMEVVYDLDVEAARVAAIAGIRMIRAATAGTAPDFVTMIRQLVEERLDPAAPRLALGGMGPWPDVCPAGCCPPAP
jgi:ferrochelatase